MSNFYEGQKVVCINDNFPCKSTTETDKSIVGTHPKVHPEIGETLVIDEILGDWLRFNKYDTDAYNWWHNSRFKPIDDIEIAMPSFFEEEIFKH